MAERLALFGRYLYVYAADLRRLLQVTEVQFLAEQTLGLAEDRADDVTPLYHPVGGDVGVNYVFCCVVHEW